MPAENSTTTVAEITNTIVDPETTIFIGNLSRDCTESDIKNIFGDDVEVEIPSRKTKRVFKQRYAFVKFSTKIDFDLIKSKYDKTVIKERGIYIRKALTEEERNAKINERQAAKKNASNTKSTKRKFVRGKAISIPSVREKIPLDEMKRSKDTLYVNNVSYHATKDEVAEFFGTKSELIVLPMRRMKDVKSGRIFYSKSMNRGIAFVTFAEITESIEKKVKDFQGKRFKERDITVDIAATKPLTSEERHDDVTEKSNE